MTNSIAFVDLEPRYSDKILVFICICDQHSIRVDDPRWVIEGDFNNITIKPSFIVGICNSHFQITGGKVKVL